MTARRWSFDQASLQWSEYWSMIDLSVSYYPSDKQANKSDTVTTWMTEINIESTWTRMLNYEICTIWWNPFYIAICQGRSKRSCWSVLAGSFFSCSGFRKRLKYSNRTVSTTLSIPMVQLALGFSCQYYTLSLCQRNYLTY